MGIQTNKCSGEQNVIYIPITEHYRKDIYIIALKKLDMISWDKNKWGHFIFLNINNILS